MEPTKSEIQAWFEGLQDRICTALEEADGQGKFREDHWQRPGGGGGRSRVIEGRVIEKGGVNFSAVEGALPEKIGRALQLPVGSAFFASGVSIVLHSHSPHLPIIHMNVRYFEIPAQTAEAPSIWWFGGGIDLTPHYVVPADAQRFHQHLKMVCDRHHQDFYPKFKKWADDYFYLRHRKETRGVGGIFFDRMQSNDYPLDKRQLFQFVQDVGDAFAPIYTQLMAERADLPFSEREKNWQLHRRGRYVEFNLVWDRGTKFGLDTDGRTESILMSMPPTAKWTYAFEVEPNSAEATTLDHLKKEIDWVGITDIAR